MTRQVSHLVVGAIYHPPNAADAPTASRRPIVNSVGSVLQQYPYAAIMILGDYDGLNDKLIRDYR
jgi:hypothetical protein